MGRQITDKAQVFLTYWRIFSDQDIAEPQPEYPFSKEIGRRHRFDWAWPEQRIAVEVDGGNMMTRRTRSGRVIPVGRHTKPSDYEKLNIAAMMGWRVFRFTPEMLVRDPELCVTQVMTSVRDCGVKRVER